jgi:hypothetical protein
MAWILVMELTPRTSWLFIVIERKSSMATTLIERLNASCNATVGILGDGMSMWEIEGGVEGEQLRDGKGIGLTLCMRRAFGQSGMRRITRDLPHVLGGLEMKAIWQSPICKTTY